MNGEMFRQLYEYNIWANRRLWDCVMQISEAQFDADNAHSRGPIHVQVAHIMGVEFWWFKFLSTGQLDFAGEADYATRQTISAKWEETEAMSRAYLGGLTDTELQREVKPEFWTAEQPPIKVWEAIMQVLLHSADHRAQALAALHAVGGPTTPQDFLFYHFDRAGVSWEND